MRNVNTAKKGLLFVNDTPDSEAPRLVSRRTVAKTAAWAAPAIAVAAASPAHAASAAKDPGGVISLSKSTFTLETSSAYVGRITGTLTPKEGEVPADLVLSLNATAGFTLLTQPVLSADRRSFEFLVQGTPTGARSGTLTVSAVNHANWAPAEAALEKEVPSQLPVGTPTLVYDEYVFRTTPGGTTTLTGKIVVPEGTQLPPGIQLVAYTSIRGWDVVGGETAVRVVGDTFSFDVTQWDLERHFGYFQLVWMAPNLGPDVPVPVATAYSWDGLLYN